MFDEHTKLIVAKAAHDDTLASYSERKRLVNYVRNGIAAKDTVITNKEACTLLGITQRTGTALAHQGRLRRIMDNRTKKRRNVSLASVEEILDAKDAYTMAKCQFGEMQRRRKAKHA